jgi:hypothetical protein
MRLPTLPQQSLIGYYHVRLLSNEIHTPSPSFNRIWIVEFTSSNKVPDILGSLGSNTQIQLKAYVRKTIGLFLLR